jgi:predicted transcriptional regulator
VKENQEFNARKVQGVPRKTGPTHSLSTNLHISIGSLKETREIFHEQFPDASIPAKSTVQDLTAKWRAAGSVLNAKRKRLPSVRTPEAVANIQHRILARPNKSVRKLSQQSGLKRTSCHRALRSLHLKLYRVSCVQELRPADKEKRVKYCEWFLKKIVEGELDQTLYFMSDESWFHLSGHVNSQDTRYWSAENPHNLHQVPLHDQKIGVWCAVSASRIIGPIFFDTTVNTDVYFQIFENFYYQLTENERQQCFSQKDGATCHTSHHSLTRIHETFTEKRTVSKGLWPPRSPDLSSCDFYLWGYLKVKVCENNPKTTDELKENLRRSIEVIDINVLRKVTLNVILRAKNA